MEKNKKIYQELKKYTHTHEESYNFSQTYNL